MSEKYDIRREYRILRCFHAPMIPGFLPAANAFLRMLPRTLPRSYGIVSRAIRIPSCDGRAVPAVIYSPRKASDRLLPALIYYHGGAFAIAAAKYQMKLAGMYAAGAGCRVIFIDYRLSPRYKYPVPFNDCYDAFTYTARNAEALGIDRRLIAVGGDSAGGCLAAAVSQRARDEAAIQPCYQMLVYPVTDRRMLTASMRRFADTPIWDSRRSATMWRWYLGGENGDGAMYASPAEAASFTGLPDAYVECAEFDCLCDEGAEYASALGAAGCRVTLNRTRGTVHGYDLLLNREYTREQVHKRIEALKTAFGEKYM